MISVWYGLGNWWYNLGHWLPKLYHLQGGMKTFCFSNIERKYSTTKNTSRLLNNDFIIRCVILYLTKITSNKSRNNLKVKSSTIKATLPYMIKI